MAICIGIYSDPHKASTLKLIFYCNNIVKVTFYAEKKPALSLDVEGVLNAPDGVKMGLDE